MRPEIDWYDANFVLVQGTIINLLLALSLQVPFRFGVFRSPVWAPMASAATPPPS